MSEIGNNSNIQKIEKATNFLWVIWWWSLFFLILPFGIAGVTAFSLNRLFPSIPWIIELSYSVFLLMIPVFIMIFLIPYEKYRKRKFFVKTEQPTIKHIVLFSLLPSFPLLYTILIRFFLIQLAQDFPIFFGTSNLFIRILYPLFAFVLVLYYLATRKTSDSSSLFKKSIKIIDRSIIGLNLLTQSVSIILLPHEAMFPFLVLNSVVFLILSFINYLILKNAGSGDLAPADFKIRLLFNVGTVMHLTCSLLMIG